MSRISFSVKPLRCSWARACLLALVALSAGCGKNSGTTTSSESNLTPPADEATPDERALIDSTLAKIEATATELGHPATFRKIPVIVTTATQYITEAKGACVKAGKRPQFILLRPMVLSFESHLPGDSKATTLLPALLHEIGHCYFSREHDDALIRSSGFEIAMTAPKEDRKLDENWDSLDATVMAAQKLFMPKALARYYVAELLGLVPQRTLEAVAKYAPEKTSLKYVKLEKLPR